MAASSRGRSQSSHESAKSPRRLHIQPPALAVGLRFAAFDLAIYDGAETQALTHAVAARTRVPPDAFYLTDSIDPCGMVVPLTAALPDGMVLVLHTTDPPPRCLATETRVDIPAFAPALAPAKASSSNLLQLPRIVSHSASHNSLKDSLIPRTPAGEEDNASGVSLQSTSDQVGRSPSDGKRSIAQWGSALLNGSRANHEEDMVTAIERFSRLTTDLANERTLLAWIRTCLAAIRTVFAYFGVAGEGGQFWTISIIGSEMAMAVFVLLLAFTGHARYHKIKTAIGMRIAPSEYGRISTRYMYTVLFFASFATVTSILARHAEKVSR